MEKLTRLFIFNLALLAGIVAFVIAGRDGWAVFFSILLFIDKI
jgi:hypothetical protein